MTKNIAKLVLFVAFIAVSISFTFNTEGTDSAGMGYRIQANNFEKNPDNVEPYDRGRKVYPVRSQEFDQKAQAIIWELKGKAPNISFEPESHNHQSLSLLEEEKIPYGTVEGKTAGIKKMLIEYKIEY